MTNPIVVIPEYRECYPLVCTHGCIRSTGAKGGGQRGGERGKRRRKKIMRMKEQGGRWKGDQGEEEGEVGRRKEIEEGGGGRG